MIGALLGLLASAWAATCTTPLTEPPAGMSVAWVSPLGARAAARGYLTVVPTAELTRWVAAERPSLGRLLQHLGEQKRADNPRRLYKVIVFEVATDDVCRPLDGYSDPRTVAGVVTCSPARSRVNGRYEGCGLLTDRADPTQHTTVYRVRWGDAAREGFCVLPAERFLAPPR